MSFKCMDRITFGMEDNGDGRPSSLVSLRIPSDEHGYWKIVQVYAVCKVDFIVYK